MQDAGYSRRHKRVAAARGPARNQQCVVSDDGSHQALDWAQRHGTDGESPDDYQPMCRKHHIAYDYDVENGMGSPDWRWRVGAGRRGQPSQMLGQHHTEEVRARITSALHERWSDPERRERQRQKMLEYWAKRRGEVMTDSGRESHQNAEPEAS